jgi:hypothetical protein
MNSSRQARPRTQATAKNAAASTRDDTTTTTTTAASASASSSTQMTAAATNSNRSSNKRPRNSSNNTSTSTSASSNNMADAMVERMKELSDPKLSRTDLMKHIMKLEYTAASSTDIDNGTSKNCPMCIIISQAKELWKHSRYEFKLLFPVDDADVKRVNQISTKCIEHLQSLSIVQIHRNEKQQYLDQWLDEDVSYVAHLLFPFQHHPVSIVMLFHMYFLLSMNIR